MKTKIYVITEPDGEIRYIGKTVKSLSIRLNQHLATVCRGRKTHLYNWMRGVMSGGYLPTIRLIGEVEGDGCKEEIAWIAYGRKEGWRLVNTTDGGEGIVGYKWTNELLKRLQKRLRKNPPHLGYKHSLESRQKISESLKGKPSWMKGKHCSKEHKRKISESRKGQKLSSEHRLKIKLSNMGKHFAPRKWRIL